MLKKLTITMLFLFLSYGMINSQSLVVKPYGISDRGAAKDSTDIFDVRYNGLLNVGVGTKIYVGAKSDAELMSPQWNISTKPAGSATAVLATADVDSATQVIALILDTEGTYKIDFSNSDTTMTVTFNAGLYISNKTEPINCGTCHNEFDGSHIYDKWSNTLHAKAMKANVDVEGHFAEHCLSCHTTGYDANADNNGFDDFDFEFPATLGPGTYDSLVTKYPDAMMRADIQCESCHGPGDMHNGDISDSKMVYSTAASVCASCHDSGTHHAIPAQFDISGFDASDFDGRGFEGGHARGSFVQSAGTRSGCSPCHSGTGYIEWIKEGRPSNSDGLPAATQVLPEAENFSCVTCHDPHDAANPHQLRATETNLGDGTVISYEKYGTGAQCMDCHRSRRQASTYAEDITNGSSHFGAHHGPQADMVIGTNAPNYGVEFPTSPHAIAVLPSETHTNACVNCHMAGESAFDSEGNVLTFGGHTFNMNNEEGEDNVEACAPCHGEIGSSFKDKKFYLNGNADLDGDGVANGLQIEVHGLLDTLALYLPKNEDGEVDIEDKYAKDSVLTPEITKGGYVYKFVEEDRSFGIHNPQFEVAMLKTAIAEMQGTPVGVDEFVAKLPTDYNLSQNYPNPFNPTTVINFSIPKAGNVSVKVFDALGREVSTLIDKKMNAGMHSVNWNAANFAAGIYFYNIRVNDFVATKKMVLLK